MICNGYSLLSQIPIKQMLSTKYRDGHGTSFGLTEAGYDIRIKQKITFHSWFFGLINWTTTDDGTKKKRRIGRFVLASAIEEFNMPFNLVGVLHDKSTHARRGISVFNTVLEPGWKGFLTIEIAFKGNKNITLHAGSGIGQILFHTLQGAAQYKGKYLNQADEPVEAILS